MIPCRGGHVRVLVGTVPGYAGQFQSQGIRGLAVSSEQRVPEYADIPTCGEGGFPFVAVSWVGVFAPAKVAETIAAKLNAAINEIVAEPATEAKLRTFSAPDIQHSDERAQPRRHRALLPQRGRQVAPGGRGDRDRRQGLSVHAPDGTIGKRPR